MHLIETIVTHTPPAILLALLLIAYRGYRFTRPRVRRVRVYLIVPGLFLVWSAVQIAAGFDHATETTMSLTALVLALAIGAPLGWFTIATTGFAVDHRRQTARLPGSWVPLIRYLFLFIANDAIMVIDRLHLLPAGRIAIVTNAVTGFTLGYFAAWLARFYMLYRQAPQTDLAPAAA